MVTLEAVVKNPKGLHGRPTGMVVHLAKQHACRLTINYLGKTAEAKSIISIMSLGITGPATLEVAAEGQDEKEAALAMKELIESIYIEE